MNVRILKSFQHASSPIPFQPQECITVPDATARQWIKRGDAVELPTQKRTVEMAATR